MLEKLEDIDEILAGFEDWMHGEDGNKCTHARKLIIELKALIAAKPIVSRSKCDYHAAFTFCGDNGITYCSNCGDPV